jgi:glycogen phosphorylase
MLDQIASGYFSPGNPELFKPIIDSLLYKGDPFLLLADFEAYAECQKVVSKAYLNSEEWTRKSILNVAHIGKFSSDRSIAEYSKEIWNAKPVPVELEPDLPEPV